MREISIETEEAAILINLLKIATTRMSLRKIWSEAVDNKTSKDKRLSNTRGVLSMDERQSYNSNVVVKAFRQTKKESQSQAHCGIPTVIRVQGCFHLLVSSNWKDSRVC